MYIIIWFTGVVGFLGPNKPYLWVPPPGGDTACRDASIVLAASKPADWPQARLLRRMVANIAEGHLPITVGGGANGRGWGGKKAAAGAGVKPGVGGGAKATVGGGANGWGWGPAAGDGAEQNTAPGVAQSSGRSGAKGSSRGRRRCSHQAKAAAGLAAGEGACASRRGMEWAGDSGGGRARILQGCGAKLAAGAGPKEAMGSRGGGAEWVGDNGGGRARIAQDCGAKPAARAGPKEAMGVARGAVESVPPVAQGEAGKSSGRGYSGGCAKARSGAATSGLAQKRRQTAHLGAEHSCFPRGAAQRSGGGGGGAIKTKAGVPQNWRRRPCCGIGVEGETDAQEGADKRPGGASVGQSIVDKGSPAQQKDGASWDWWGMKEKMHKMSFCWTGFTTPYSCLLNGGGPGAPAYVEDGG
ncbi:hypothetical protein B0H19DRAFT_1082091 [Mycena capillaripes]|nr:hypothetical protein B0H19DRAFT_1082091 [Mycena capillaripes]